MVIYTDSKVKQNAVKNHKKITACRFTKASHLKNRPAILDTEHENFKRLQLRQKYLRQYLSTQTEPDCGLD